MRLTRTQIGLLSGLGVVLGPVLFILGYGLYSAACYPNGPLPAGGLCYLPDEPNYLALMALGVLLTLASICGILLAWKGPSIFTEKRRVPS